MDDRDFELMKDTDKAWLAGLFEGEGCITTGSNCVQIKIVMTDKDVIEKVDILFPSSSGVKQFKNTEGLGNKKLYIWRITKGDYVKKFINIILPWLGKRRKEKALWALEYLSTRPGVGNYYKNKTHCPKGHPYYGDNLYINPSSGGRSCRICLNEHSRKFQANKRKLEKEKLIGSMVTKLEKEKIV